MIYFSRWQAWLPRLLFIAVAVLAVQYGLGVATRSKLMEMGAAALGARVDVSHARWSLFNRQVVLHDLCVANPCRPNENFVEADRCEVVLAAAPLLHKQVIIEQGVISGLRFGTPRDEPGAPPDASVAQTARSVQWFNDEYSERSREWINQLNRRYDPELIKQSQSIQRTAALCESVPGQSAALVRCAQELAERAEALQQQFDTALENPLRNKNSQKAVPDEIAELRRRLDDLVDAVQKLPDQIDADRREIVAARRQDETWLRDQLRMPAVDANMLTAYLLRAQVSRSLDELMGWLRMVRQISPVEQIPTLPARSRGENICFVGSQRVAGLLVRSLALHGTARIGGLPVELHGTLSDAASIPSLHDQPMRLRLKTAGALPMELQATIDRTSATARDELLADCRGLVLRKENLGENERLRLALAPSVGDVSISIQLGGDNLSGDIQLVRKQVQITPTIGADLSDVPMGAALDATLGDVNAFAVRVSLSGTLQHPKCSLWSNLGPAVAEALDRALRRAAEQHARGLLAEAQQCVDQQLTQLERRLADDQAELSSHLVRASNRLEKIAIQHGSPQRLCPEQLGRRLPANSLFR